MCPACISVVFSDAIVWERYEVLRTIFGTNYFLFFEILDSNRDAFNFPSMQPTKFNANMHFSSSDIPLFVTEFLLVFFTSQSSIFIIDDLFQKNYVTILNEHI